MLSLVPQAVSPLLHLEPDCRQVGVILGAHEDQFVAAPTPGSLHMPGPGLVVLRACHHPAEDPHLVGEGSGRR